MDDSSVREASANVNRNDTRKLIRKASQGKVHSFARLCSQYIDFLSEYYCTLGYVDKEERTNEITKLLTKCWRYLPYSKRVSDFERFLFTQLEKQDPIELSGQHPQFEKFPNFGHSNRFLLAARVLGNWSYKSIMLASRVDKKDLPQQLMQLKAKLIGFRPAMLRPEERANIVIVSELLEGRYAQGKMREIEKSIASYHHSLKFKAEWLEYRCNLIEALQSLRFSSEETEALIEKASAEARSHPMERPRLMVNLANHISFERIPAEAYQ